jgi:hypothetical protein
MNIKEVLQHLYDSEINYSLEALWDTAIIWRLETSIGRHRERSEVWSEP